MARARIPGLRSTLAGASGGSDRSDWTLAPAAAKKRLPTLETFEAFDELVGFDRLRVVHGNDSKHPCDSRVDRHEHIGDGCLGLEPFRRLLHDRRFTGLPILIET